MTPRKGNTNALKHGLYARRFTDTEKQLLKKMDVDDLRQEIALLRVVVDRILDKVPDGDPDTYENFLKGYSTLVTTVDKLVNAIQSYAILTGDYDPDQEDDDEALRMFDTYLKKRRENPPGDDRSRPTGT